MFYSLPPAIATAFADPFPAEPNDFDPSRVEFPSAWTFWPPFAIERPKVELPFELNEDVELTDEVFP